MSTRPTVRRFTRCASLLLLAATACARGDAERGARRPSGRLAADAAARIDDFGDTVSLAPAARIVSLSPMTTELLFAIGAGARVVGRTDYDAWPAGAKQVPSVGAGIRPNVERVLAARPDLVVLYAANDNRAAARALRAAGVRTLALKSDRLADLDRAATVLGAVAGAPAAARQLVDTVHQTLHRVAASVAGLPRPRVLWLLWDNPPMVLGNGSYQSELLAIAGGENVYRDRPEAAAQVSMEDLLGRDPEVIFADPGADVVLRTSDRWKGVRAVRARRVVTIDDTLLNRPGVTLGMAAVSLARALHPGWREP